MRGCPQRGCVFRHLNRRQTFGLIQSQIKGCKNGAAPQARQTWPDSAGRVGPVRRPAPPRSAEPAPRLLFPHAASSHGLWFAQRVLEAEGGCSLVSPRVFAPFQNLCRISDSLRDQFFQDSIIKTIGYN